MQGKSTYLIDFKNEVKKVIDGIETKVLMFYQKLQGNIVQEYAFIAPDSKLITYKTSDGDMNYIDIQYLNDFVFNLYNRINKQPLLSKSKTSKPHYNIKIIGKNIPLGIYLLYTVPKRAFQMMQLKYQFRDKKDNDAGMNIKFTTNGKLQYLCLYPDSNKSQFYANGINTYKLGEMQGTLDGLQIELGKVITEKFGVTFATNLKDIDKKFIDTSTFKILQDSGFSTQLQDVFAKDMMLLLDQRGAKSQYDLDNYRLRMSETITSIAYKQMHQAMSKFKKNKHLSEEKITTENDYIIRNLIDAGIMQYTKTLNPLEELMLSLKVTKTGIGNMEKGQVTLNRRDTNATYFGHMGPTATNEYGGIGVNQTLTNGSSIQDRFGNLNQNAFDNNSNSFENLSPVESLTPFFEYDDTTRRVMGNQQTSQFIQLQKPDVPLVQTGFESYIPHLVSDRFTKKAKHNGKIQEVNDKDITIIYSTGEKEIIDITPVKARTKRGVYVSTHLTPTVSQGQKVIAGSILAASDSLKTGKLAIGKNLVLAEMGYLGMNYEDGWVISDKLQDKFKNTVLQKINIHVPEDAKIMSMHLTEGAMTKTGDVLIKYNTSKEFLDDDPEDADDNYESVIVGLETDGHTKTYRSPGGKIAEIVVKLNSKKVPKQVHALYEDKTSKLKKLVQQCKQYTGDRYTDCIGHLENGESLNIGGHKLNQEEFEGAVIEIYIEKENPIINGSKFTLTNSGGKGTVQYIMEHGQEPIAQNTGLVIEFVATPLSIISRKNPSILLSMYLGKVIYFLNLAVKKLSSEKKLLAIKKLVLEIFTCIDKTKDQMLLNQLHEFFKLPGNEIFKIINASEALNNPAFPAIVPPFKNKITIRDIQDAANILSIPLNERVLVKENNNITTYKEVPVGIIPVYLLEHFPQAMSSTRGSVSTGRNMLTGQGRSGTKEGTGAIKVGLYDMNSLLSKRPYHLIKELHTIKSDALKAKKQMINTIIRKNIVPDNLDIQVNTEDLQSANMIKILFEGAGLEADI